LKTIHPVTAEKTVLNPREFTGRGEQTGRKTVAVSSQGEPLKEKNEQKLLRKKAKKNSTHTEGAAPGGKQTAELRGEKGKV